MLLFSQVGSDASLHIEQASLCACLCHILPMFRDHRSHRTDRYVSGK